MISAGLLTGLVIDSGEGVTHVVRENSANNFNNMIYFVFNSKGRSRLSDESYNI
jgi:hypothetical protein